MLDQLKLFSISIVLILTTGCAQPSETVSQTNPISQTKASGTTVAILQTKPRGQSKPGVLPADQMLADAINYFNKNDYQVTINIADSLHREYPGSPEDIEAQILKEKAKIKKTEIRASSTNLMDTQEYKDEETVYKLLSEANIRDLESWIKNRSSMNPEQIELLNKIIKEYPNTSYVALSKEYLSKAAEYQKEADERETERRAEALLDEAFDRYPNPSYDTAILKDLIKKYPNTAASKKALEILAEKEGNKETIRSTIRITKLKNSKPNSVGGVDLYIGFRNLSKKTIKYATFTVTAYNAVGDSVNCQIRGDSTFDVGATGPFDTGEGFSGSGKYWEAVWYSWSISKVKLDRISIEYMDGTEVSFSEGLDAAFE